MNRSATPTAYAPVQKLPVIGLVDSLPDTLPLNTIEVLLMYIPGAEKLVAKLFGGVKPHHRLSPEELKLAEPTVKEIAKGIWPWIVLPWVLIILSGVVAVYIRDRLTGASVNPIVDDRSSHGWLSIALLAMAGGAFAVLTVRPIIMRRRFGEDANLYDCYMGTKEGWLPKRCAWFWGIALIPLLFVSYLGIFSLGRCIDERGMLVTHNVNGLVPHFHTYPQVTSIDLYSQLMAPIGLRIVSNLVVSYDDGTSFIYMPDDDLSAPQPLEVANYISQRSGKPVIVGLTRP